MTHHTLDGQTISRTIRILERTWVGVADQDDLLEAIKSLREALATPLNTGRSTVVISSH